MSQNPDVVEVCTLLGEQTDVLWGIYHAATEPPGKQMPKADYANFLFYNAVHIRAMAKASLVLIQNHEPYAVAMLGRSALESAFNLMAAMNDRQFAPQRMAFELEELSKKLKFLSERGMWSLSRRPTPEECTKKAEQIRQLYSALQPQDAKSRNRIQKVEEIAKTAGLLPCMMMIIGN